MAQQLHLSDLAAAMQRDVVALFVRGSDSLPYVSVAVCVDWLLRSSLGIKSRTDALAICSTLVEHGCCTLLQPATASTAAADKNGPGNTSQEPPRSLLFSNEGVPGLSEAHFVTFPVSHTPSRTNAAGGTLISASTSPTATSYLPRPSNFSAASPSLHGGGGSGSSNAIDHLNAATAAALARTLAQPSVSLESDASGTFRAAPVPDTSSQSKLGFMQKKGHIRHNWKKRWFVLEGHTLSYFRTNKARSAIAELSLLNARPAERVASHRRPFVFRLQLADGVSYMLHAISETDMDEWISALNRAIHVQNTPHSDSSSTSASGLAANKADMRKSFMEIEQVLPTDTPGRSVDDDAEGAFGAATATDDDDLSESGDELKSSDGDEFDRDDTDDSDETKQLQRLAGSGAGDATAPGGRRPASDVDDDEISDARHERWLRREAQSAVTGLTLQGQSSIDSAGSAASTSSRESDGQVAKQAASRSASSDTSTALLPTALQNESGLLFPQAASTRPLKSGYLVKKGHIRHNWKTRWFVLHSSCLEYYLSNTHTEPIHVIPLDGCKVDARPYDKRNRRYMFYLTDSNGVEYHFHAPDRDEMMSWTSAIDKAIRNFWPEITPPTEKPRTKLEEIAVAMRDKDAGLRLTDRIIRLKTHHNCVCGADIVSWLISWAFAATREEALALAQSMMDDRLLRSTSKKEAVLQDSVTAFYKLNDLQSAEMKRRAGSIVLSDDDEADSEAGAGASKPTAGDNGSSRG